MMHYFYLAIRLLYIPVSFGTREQNNLPPVYHHESPTDGTRLKLKFCPDLVHASFPLKHSIFLDTPLHSPQLHCELGPDFL
jgi:hypothetical protein